MTMKVKTTYGAVTISRERLDAGGYTVRGAYFGTGLPLFAVFVEFANGETLTGYVRHTGARALAVKLGAMSSASDLAHAFAYGVSK